MPTIEILLIIVLLIREFMSYRERSKLMDRIMSKNFEEYKSFETPEDNDILEQEDDGTIPILEAKEEILHGERIN
jgi:hypothetical protein